MDPNTPITTVYFLRHAEADNSVRDGRIRPLTEKGAADIRLLPAAFKDIHIDRVYSSPFKRAVDTVTPVAWACGLDITLIEDFRERRSDSVQSIPMPALISMQWKDFSYTLSDGECLAAVQRRNIAALRGVLDEAAGMTIVIGTHGMALCTMMKYFNEAMGEQEVAYILPRMPCIERMVFAGGELTGMKEVMIDGVRYHL